MFADYDWFEGNEPSELSQIRQDRYKYSSK